jgi:uncharacterized membrane protein
LVPGLFAGALALPTAWFALDQVLAVPLAGLALNVALAWGAFSVVCLGLRLRPASHALWVPALAPWIAVAMLLRMHLIAAGDAVPLWMATTWTLEALSVISAVFVALAYGHFFEGWATARGALLTTGALGLALTSVILLLHIAMPQPVASGALVVLTLTLLAVVGALALQHLTWRKNAKPLVRSLAGGAALAVAASQLLDGFVTYLAVVDPFNLMARELSEQMVVSAWLLENTGLGYPLVKWGLALALAYILERSWDKSADSTKRTGTYLVLLAVGLGPALYSMANLLA